MILTTYTIIETTFQEGVELESKTLRFRDKDTRNKYLKNITLKPYLAKVEAGDATVSTYDLNPRNRINFKTEFEDSAQNLIIRIKAGIEHIEIIESIYQNENQLQLDL